MRPITRVPGIILISLLFLLTSVGCGPRSSSSTESLVPEQTPSAVESTLQGEGLPIPLTITEDMVEKLYLGHTYESIVELFGREADQRESEYIRGTDGYTSPYTIVWHSWENTNGTTVRLGFINSKLDRKVFVRSDGNVISNEINLESL